MSVNGRHSTEYLEYLQSPHWKQLRQECLEFAGFTCERCRKVSGELHVHHLTYEHLWDEWEDDLQVLCPDCHKTADKERETKSSEDRREKAIETFGRKKYGQYWDEDRSYEEVEEAFDEWIDSK